MNKMIFTVIWTRLSST